LYSDYGANHAPHSFPTRRSSDLRRTNRPPTRDHTSHKRRLRLIAAHRPGFDLTLEVVVTWHAQSSPPTRGAPTLGGVTSEHRDRDRKSTRLNSSHVKISYAVFCL